MSAPATARPPFARGPSPRHLTGSPIMPAAWNIDLQSADAVRGAFAAGARANREAACRRGSIDLIEPPGTLIATGDLHDNPVHFQKLVLRAGLGDETGTEGPAAAGELRDEGTKGATHLLLHEIIHSDRLVNGMDFSYRALARVAALKAAFPERVHAILANHELAQMVGAGIVKDGVKVVEAFNEGVEYAFGDDAPAVDEAIKDFVRSMPLALRCRTPKGDILCAHSLPAVWSMQRFDPTVLDRDLTEADYEPRQGAAHLMVWGRGYDADLIEDLVERWGVTMFILGHEHVENGVLFTPPCAIVLNSDHERGVYLPIDLSAPPTPQEAAARVVPLRDPY